MENKKGILGYYIIGSALIWGLTIIGCALMLKGTDCYGKIATILGGAAGVHLILIWGPLAAQMKKLLGEKESK